MQQKNEKQEKKNSFLIYYLINFAIQTCMVVIVDSLTKPLFSGNQRKSLRFIPTTGTSFERSIEFKCRG